MTKEANEILAKTIDEVNNSNIDPNNLSLEALILLINTERLKSLQDNTLKELNELKKRQTKVAELHKILRAVNSATGSGGELDITNNEELKQLLQKAKEFGIEVKEDKTSFNREERDRLVENIRMSIDDLNVENDMQLQTVSRLTNERYESYQMARSILKPLHDAKVAFAKGIKS
ncbi:MAG TPA: hypothetical protein VIH61_03815 [Waddliaceae bacterium]